MGQAIAPDKTSSLQYFAPPSNVSESLKYTPLLLTSSIESPVFEKVFHYENYRRLQVTYKYLPDAYVHLEITKEKANQEQGYFLSLGNETVYGYKFRKNEKSDKIRPEKIYFRRKLYIPSHQPSPSKTPYREKMKNHLRNRSRTREEDSKRREGRTKSKEKEFEPKKSYQTHKQQLLRKLAELKLFSKMKMGVRIGRMIDGSDGVLTEHYIQFYSEVPICKGSFLLREAEEREKICEKLKEKGFKVNNEAIGIAYSTIQTGYILKQSPSTVKRPEEDQNENRSIKYFMKEFEEEIAKSIVKLDNISNMMTYIQNCLSQREVEKAMQKFEQNMANLEEPDKLVFAEQMAFLLGKYTFYKSYERDVSSYINSSRSSSMAESRNLSHSRFNPRSLKSDHPEDSTDFEGVKHSREDLEMRHNGSPANLSPRSIAPLRLTDSEASNKMGLNPSEQDHSVAEGLGRVSYAQSNFLMWESAQERLKNSILDNDKNGINESLTCLKNLGLLSPLEVEVYYGQILMQNAKTKHAKIIFQRILHTRKGAGHDFINSQIYCMLGYLAYSNGTLIQSLSHYQKALTLKFKLRNYSRKTALIFNNMAAICYGLERYDKCVSYLERALSLGEYCADYELVMRNNYVMVLVEQAKMQGKGQQSEQNKIKDAKLQMNKTNRNVQPNYNNQIVCKYFSNLAYLDLSDNLLQKAKANLDSATQIQDKFLIPNGYKPSLVLHNNYAMYHYKKSEWKKAALHLKKVENQLSEVHGLKAIQIHFNFAKVYKQLDNFDAAIKHFSEAKSLLAKMEEKLISRYKDKINQEIDKIEAQRIIEVSEESSYANKLSKLSKSIISQRPIDSKIWP